ncbi:MAG TPA: SDR family oxidoreductase [Blastocatellia bacterium]|nr:SDR family oxidoreductase [Blastocatellia bacterium]
MPTSCTNNQQPSKHAEEPVGAFWRVEGSLVNLSAIRPVGFFTWNAQRFNERWARRGGVALLALIRPLLYASNRIFATRVLHTLLRGVSQDRLDLLGEEYFEYVLKPQLRTKGVEKLKDALSRDPSLILVSQGLDHIMRPLAEHLGVERLVANRLEFRDGLATGRLFDPVIRPRGGLALVLPGKPDGSCSLETLSRQLGFNDGGEKLRSGIVETRRRVTHNAHPLVVFDTNRRMEPLSVRKALSGKEVLLIGATGFIGKVLLAKLLRDVPDIGKVLLLIRRQRATTSLRRFERVVEESPVFESFYEAHGDGLAEFLSERVEVVEGDVCKPGLGLSPDVRERLSGSVDVIVNSSGLTDFNPELRSALSANVDATVHLLDFVSQSDHAKLLHLSTCYVAGHTEGRVREELVPNYTPAGVAGFDAEAEYRALTALVADIETRGESQEFAEHVQKKVKRRRAKANGVPAPELESQIRKTRARWVRSRMVEAGIKRARSYGWPNTYTFTKSLAESLIAIRGRDLPVTVVRPSIVETSTQDPFVGWNEGVNTSAPISYLIGTFFRQLPSNERKCLDIVPVDLVCRGLILITAAMVEGRQERVYQLATSAVNPCDMRRSVELTSLAHRKYYRTQVGFEHRLRAQIESIPVSKARYQNLSAPRQKALLKAIQRLSAPTPLNRPLARKERDLQRVEKLIELYEPFILQNEYVFEAGNIELLSEQLIESESGAFAYDPLSIDWWEYWINIHIPALRKWSYPLIEGRPLDYEPRHAFRLSLESRNSAVIVTGQ